MYGDQFGEICMWILGLKGLTGLHSISKLSLFLTLPFLKHVARFGDVEVK